MGRSPSIVTGSSATWNSLQSAKADPGGPARASTVRAARTERGFTGRHSSIQIPVRFYIRVKVSQSALNLQPTLGEAMVARNRGVVVDLLYRLYQVGQSLLSAPGTQPVAHFAWTHGRN